MSTDETIIENLEEVSEKEQVEFLNSFDRVLCDVDGVLWLSHKIFPGAVDCLSNLRKLKKKISFISNNATISLKIWQKKLEVFGASEGDIITPSRTIIWYLNKIEMKKEIYAIGFSGFKNELLEAGFSLANDGMEVTKVEENLPAFAAAISDYSHPDKIGAVIIDFDINLTLLKLQKAVKYLQNKDVVFLSGGTDTNIPFTKEFSLIGPGYFVKAVEEVVGRKSICLSKPSPGLTEMVLTEEKIQKPQRVLFIGDSIAQDMSFATDCGFQKLLVLTGITKQEHVINWTHPQELKPNYYIDSLESLNNIINKLVGSLQINFPIKNNL